MGKKRKFEHTRSGLISCAVAFILIGLLAASIIDVITNQRVLLADILLIWWLLLFPGVFISLLIARWYLNWYQEEIANLNKKQAQIKGVLVSLLSSPILMTGRLWILARGHIDYF